VDNDVLRRPHLLIAIGGVCVGEALVVAMFAGFPRDVQPGDIAFFLLIWVGIFAQNGFDHRQCLHDAARARRRSRDTLAFHVG